MKYINPHDFYLETNGKLIDVDGAYGGQCWDLFAYFTRKYCGKTFSCIRTGYVIDLWNTFEQIGLDKYFDKVNILQDGDWAIWQGPCQITSKSHIAMFRLDNGNGTNIILTQNPNGNPNYTHQMICNYDGLVGALRPKTNQPPKVLAPNPVNQDITVNQVKVLANSTIYCRLSPDNTIENKVSNNFVSIGYYNILSEANGLGYHWYEIEKDRWIAQVDKYVEYIPKYVKPIEEPKKEEQVIEEPIIEEPVITEPIVTEPTTPTENNNIKPVEEDKQEDNTNTTEIEKVPKNGFKTIILDILNKILEYFRKRFIK